MAAFLLAGLAAGQGALLLTSDARWAALNDALADHGVDLEAVVASGQIIRKDGGATVARLSDQRFETAALAVEVRPSIDAIRAATGTTHVRAYGDMVDVLWQAGRTADAVRLEQAWHDLLKTENVTLLCAYRADALDPMVNPNHLLQVCRLHGSIAAVESGDARRAAIRHGMELTLGGREIGRLETVLAGAGLPDGDGDAEAALLWLRTQVPRLAQRVMTHAGTALDAGAALDG